MSNDNVIDSVAREYAGFSLADSEEDTDNEEGEYTSCARVMKRWFEELLATYVGQQPTIYRLAEAKVLLTDRFFSFWVSVPKAQRIGSRNRKGLFATYEEAYQKLRVMELTLIPGQIFAPPAPPPPRPELGLTLGEVLGEMN